MKDKTLRQDHVAEHKVKVNDAPKPGAAVDKRRDKGLSTSAVPVTKRVRPHAGDGLANEGTNVDYKDENRNG